MRGSVDYAIELSGCDCDIVAIMQVKLEDIRKGVAQNAVQIVSALTEQQRKASELEEFQGTPAPEGCFGIVSDAKEWYFLLCTMNDGKPELSSTNRIRWLMNISQSHTG